MMQRGAGCTRPEALAAGPFARDRGIYFHERPAMRHLFTHMAEFFPQGVVARGRGLVHDLLPAPPDVCAATASLNVRMRDREGPLAVMIDDADGLVDGFILLHRGRVALELYPNMQEDDRHIMWSVTKAVVGLGVALLAEDGAIDVAAPIDHYLPELAAGWAGISIRDILDMASGINAIEGEPAAFTDPAHPYYRYEAAIGYQPAAPEPRLTPEASIARLRPHRAPGEAYEYSSANSFALGWLIERVKGQPLARFLSDRIWRHAGGEGDMLLTLAPGGAPSAEGGLSATLRDVARFGLLYTPSSQAPGLVSAAHLEELQQAGRPALFRAGDGAHEATNGPDAPAAFNWHWDYVWPDGDFSKGGWGGQGLHVSPSRDVVVAFFATPAGSRPGRNHLLDVARQTARLLHDAI